MPTLHIPWGDLRSSFAIGEVAEALNCDEVTMRRLLNDAGADPPFDEHATDPHERVPRRAVEALTREGGGAGQRATQLLLPEGPPPVSLERMPSRADAPSAGRRRVPRGAPALSDESTALLLRIAAIASELPAEESLAFVEECGDVLDAAMRAGVQTPGVVLGPLLARYGAGMAGAELRSATEN